MERAQQQLEASEARARALEGQLRAAERGAQKLRDEEQRARSLAAQTRAACARDLRRRDRLVEDLRRAVVDAGRVRGTARSTACVTSITISEVGAPGSGPRSQPAKSAGVAARNSVASRGSRGSASGVGVGAPLGATDNEEYSLSLETNEFLTRLASGLSDENEGLRALLGRTVAGLREMSGFEPPAPPPAATAHSTTTTMKGEGNSILGNGEAGGVTVLATGAQMMRTAEELSADLDAVLEHLRTILTNPSFVPIEEVEVRDEEITRLRAGFGRLEARWRDAVLLIDGWRRRMGSGGPSVDVDELGSAGRLLSPVRVREFADVASVGERGFHPDDEGAEPEVPRRPTRLSCVHEEDEEEEEEEDARVSKVKEENQKPRLYQGRGQERASQGVRTARSPSPAESLHLVPAPDLESAKGAEQEDIDGDEDDVDSESSSIFEDDIDLDELEAEAEEPNVQVLHESTWQQRTIEVSSDSSPPLPEPPQLSPLKDSFSSGNRGLSPQHHRRGPDDFTTIVEENAWDLAADAAATAAMEAAPAEDDKEEQPPVPPPHTVDYKRRSQQDVSDNNSSNSNSKPSTGRRDGRPKASELLFSEESTMYDSPLFGRSGEKPSMSDPTRKLFASRPSSPPRLTIATSPRKERRLLGDQPKSTPGSPIRTSAGSPTQASKLARSNPEPVPTSPKQQQHQQQQSNRQSPVTTVTTRTRSNSANSKTAAKGARSSTSGSGPTIIPVSSNSPTRNGNATTPPRNSSGNGNSGGSSRLPRRNNPPSSQKQEQQQRTPLTMETIAAKLAAAEREADAARVRAKLRAARLGKRGGAANNANKDPASKRQSATGSATTTKAQAQPQEQKQDPQEPQQEQQQDRPPKVKKQSPVKPVLEDVDPVKKDMKRSPVVTAAATRPRRRVSNYNRSGHDDEADELANSPVRDQSPAAGELVVPKRKRDRRTSAVAAASARRASRRRSTLSPWELESLIQGNVGIESPAR